MRCTATARPARPNSPSGPAWRNDACANGRWRRPPTATSRSTGKTQRFSLTPEQAMVFAVKDSPVYLEGAFDLVAAMVEGRPKVEAAFKHGGGVAWGESSGLPVLRGRRILPAGLRQQHRPVLASRAGRHAEKAERRHQGRGYRLRRRLLDAADGEGVSRRARSSATTSTPLRSSRPTRMPGRMALPIACAS